jgi:CRISPR system Cascade subunit CasE
MFESLVRFTPQDPARTAQAMHDRGHRLIWTLFAQNRAARDFLYQPIPGHPFSAVVRSSRPPQVAEGWLVKTRAFAPQLKAGQTLGFRLEAVPFRWRPVPGARRGKREDLVTAVRRVHPDSRQNPDLETSLVHGATQRWFAEQGIKQGFAVASNGFVVSAYDQELRTHNPKGAGRHFRFTSFLYEGRLQVIDAEKLRLALDRGVAARTSNCSRARTSRAGTAGEIRSPCLTAVQRKHGVSHPGLGTFVRCLELNRLTPRQHWLPGGPAGRVSVSGRS